ncbi:MAG: nitrogenase-associated protein [Candidatus Thiodiazotropha sp. 'RUGA']|nr:nitrogenase-associated protein [Candidatus Thiodiazotropha sp. 'RUGA']
MTELVFYEKPGCIGNKQQKAILRKLGISLQVRDILSETWTSDSLRSFFGEKAISAWFNESAPQVKSGEIDIDHLNETEALRLMVEQPILIKRPLMICQSLKQSGFTVGPVLDYLGVYLNESQKIESCPMPDQPCETVP